MTEEKGAPRPGTGGRPKEIVVPTSYDDQGEPRAACGCPVIIRRMTPVERRAYFRSMGYRATYILANCPLGGIGCPVYVGGGP